MSSESTQAHQWYGYRLVSRTGRDDGRYRDTASAAVAIYAPDGTLLHTERAASQSTHQLSKRYRPAQDVGEDALERARWWVLANRPDAAAAHEAARYAARRAALAAVGGDEMAYLRTLSLELTPTDIGQALGLGGPRRVNQLLLTWGLQRQVGDGYLPFTVEHGRLVGTFAQLQWTTAGFLAIWEAAVAHGAIPPGEGALLERLHANTTWLAMAPRE